MMEEPKLTERDYELLSAYLDDMLDAGERSALEERLRQEPTLQAELEALRNVIALVKQLPTRQAPRNFTLTTAMIAPLDMSKSSRKVVGFPLSSALSAAAAFILIALGLILAMGDGDQAADLTADSGEAPVVMQAQPTTETLVAEEADLALTDVLEDTDMDALDFTGEAASPVSPGTGGAIPSSIPTATLRSSTGAGMDDAADAESDSDMADVEIFEQEAEEEGASDASDEEAEEMADDPVAMSAVAPPVTQPMGGAVGDAVPDERVFSEPPSPAFTIIAPEAQTQQNAARDASPTSSPFPTATVDRTAIANTTEIAAVNALTEEAGEAALDGTTFSEAVPPEEGDDIQRREVVPEPEAENESLPFVFIGLGIALFVLAAYLWWNNRQVTP